MNFFPNYPSDNNQGQRHIWRALKDALQGDDGVAYYRYPIFTGKGHQRREPDFVVVHRQFGIWVLESKGCLMGHIVDIEGHEWHMRDWYSPSMLPVCQAEAQFYAVRKLVEESAMLRLLKLPITYRVVLPFVSQADWQLRGFHRAPGARGVVWLQEDVQPSALRKHLASADAMPALNDVQWQRLLGIFRGYTGCGQPPDMTGSAPPIHSARHLIHSVESRLQVLDDRQSRIAQQVPEGPQRLRGLAGSGKTVLFARRIAQIHAAYPDWNVALVYWSRALHQQIHALVQGSYVRLTGEQPNWDRLHIWHAWGSRERPGFYSETAHHWGQRNMGLDAARKQAHSGEPPFAAACRVLEEAPIAKTPFLDVLMVDEGQDLPASFYRLALQALRPPQRLYWGI